MHIISTVRSLFLARTPKAFICLSLAAVLASCNSSVHQQQAHETDLSPISHVAHFIATPFKSSVEKDLRSLIHEVVNQEADCNSTPDREKLITKLISPNSVQALQKKEAQYWDKALPTEVEKKQEVLDSVEQNLALHMHNIKQSISATGLKIGDNDTKVVLLSSNMPQIKNIQASSPRFVPSPILKDSGRFASRFSPVPVLKLKANAPVPLYKAVRNDTAKGGPFVPLQHENFSQRYRDLSETLKQLVMLENLYTTLPIGNPMPEGQVTSGFGVRRDPFNHRWARHTGIDFSSRGTPAVHSTGTGKVVFAGYRNDYGNMVIVNHGHGLTSSYAHLSKISVRKGQDIKDGGLVGYQGNTGRATGSHLHYEVRMNGRAIDPANFVASTPPVCRYKTASLEDPKKPTAF